MRDIFVKEGRVHGYHLLGGGAEVLVNDGLFQAQDLGLGWRQSRSQ